VSISTSAAVGMVWLVFWLAIAVVSRVECSAYTGGQNGLPLDRSPRRCLFFNLKLREENVAVSVSADEANFQRQRYHKCSKMIPSARK